MAFFKLRWPGKQETEGDGGKPGKRSRAAQAESIEDMRRRARHRLYGAVVLVLAGVVGFPLLFDTQPRPVPVNVAIDIPDRNQVAPLPPPQAEPAAPAEPAATPAPEPSAQAVPAPQPQAQPELKPELKPEPKPEPKPEHKVEPKTAKPAKPDEGARVLAMLEDRPAPAAVAKAGAGEAGRFIVQVGAFADAAKAREARDKLERAGLKTYTQVVDTKDGKRTRVRVGPFERRAEADKAAERVKSAGLAAAVLAL